MKMKLNGLVFLLTALCSWVASAQTVRIQPLGQMEITQNVDMSKCGLSHVDYGEGYAVACRFQLNTDSFDFKSFRFSDDQFETEVRFLKKIIFEIVIFQDLWVDDPPWTDEGNNEFLKEVQNWFRNRPASFSLIFDGPVPPQIDNLLVQIRVN